MEPEKSRLARHHNTAGGAAQQQAHTPAGAYTMPNHQYQNVSSFLEEKGHSNAGSPTSSALGKTRARLMQGGHDKLFGQFVQRIQGQQAVPTIVVGQVLKRISQQQGWEQTRHHKRNKSLVPSVGSGQWSQITATMDEAADGKQQHASIGGTEKNHRAKYHEYALTDAQKVSQHVNTFTNPPIITTPPFQPSPSLYNEMPPTPMNMN